MILFRHRAADNLDCAGTIRRVKILVSTTNNKKTGGKDEYKLLKEVRLRDEKCTINLSSIPSSFYKIVLEAEHNTVNYWIKK